MKTQSSIIARILRASASFALICVVSILIGIMGFEIHAITRPTPYSSAMASILAHDGRWMATHVFLYAVTIGAFSPLVCWILTVLWRRRS